MLENVNVNFYLYEREHSWNNMICVQNDVKWQRVYHKWYQMLFINDVTLHFTNHITYTLAQDLVIIEPQVVLTVRKGLRFVATSFFLDVSGEYSQSFGRFSVRPL